MVAMAVGLLGYGEHEVWERFGLESLEFEPNH